MKWQDRIAYFSHLVVTEPIVWRTLSKLILEFILL